MLVLGVVADLYYVKESSSNAAAVESQTIEEESIETLIKNVKENLTEDEMQQVDRVYTMYAYNEDSYQEDAEYLDSSLLMQLNPEEIPTVLLSYQISRNISEEEIRNIMTMYESTLLDETSCADIVDVIGKKYKNTAVKELVSITDNISGNDGENIVMVQNVDSGILNIRIYALEQKQCEKIADVIKNRMQAYTEQLQQVFGEFSAQNISEQYYLSSDSTISEQKMNIVSAMNSAYSYMNNATIGFTEDQLTYFNLLTKPLDESMNQKERDTAEQNVADTAVKMNYFSAKYVLVGLIAGAFLVAFWYACVYIISQTVKDTDDLKVVTGIPIFGTVLSNGKLDKRNKVDKWIDSLFSRGKKKEDDAVLLERVCHEIELHAKKNEVKNILVTSSADVDHIVIGDQAIYVIKTVKFPKHVELYGSSDAKNWYYAENTDKQETHKHKVDNLDKRNQSYCEYIQMLAGEAIRRDVPAIAIVNIIGLTDEQIHLDIESGHEVVTMDKLADRIRYYESTIDSDRVAYEHSDDLIRKFKEEEVYDNIIPQIRDVELKYRVYTKLSEGH